ncbi:MAG: FAD-binding oxidoreductase [Patescibacteria group bacterium]
MPIPNHSPWIKQLKRVRGVSPINRSQDSDVAIVGGGIAGVVTAYFILRNTDKKVVLLEADKIAHGATGHNAGQITSYFERPLTELVEEFGFDLALDGQRSVESGWLLIDQIMAEAKLQTPLYRFTGYASLSTLDQVILQLKCNRFRVQGGLPAEQLIVSEEWSEHTEIPEEFKDLYELASHKDVLNLIESNNPVYIASLSYQKGCMNSAMFSEELAGYLGATYKDRFSFYEGSPVKTVQLKEGGGSLLVLGYTVNARNIVLCTNGFQNFKILNTTGREIDTKFHHSIAGRIGYMSGYVEPMKHPPIAISYLPKDYGESIDPTGEEYFYLTRRPHEHEGDTSFNLTCTGGPEKVLPNHALYSREEASSEDMRILIDNFLRDNYNKYPETDFEYAFSWHGLMGYTPNGIRRVGPEPCNTALLYNLGCNGVGILPSIFGGMRISRFIKGEKVEQSIFDPHDQRCEIE